MEEDMEGRSPKRSFDGDARLEIGNISVACRSYDVGPFLVISFSRYNLFIDKKQVELVELKDLQKEYMLVNARLTLLREDPEPSHMVGKYRAENAVAALELFGPDWKVFFGFGFRANLPARRDSVTVGECRAI